LRWDFFLLRWSSHQATRFPIGVSDSVRHPNDSFIYGLGDMVVESRISPKT
jgi:hypothetical protein